MTDKMTIEQAIAYLKNHYLVYIEYLQDIRVEIEKHNAVMDMAIEALGEKRHCEECGCDIYKTLCAGCKAERLADWESDTE